MAKKIQITCALPYANGSMHIGHLLEHVQTDIFSRFLKMRGEDAIFICGDDTHGTAIEIRAEKEKIKPEELIARYQKEHYEDFIGFDIKYDFYGSTHCEENRKWAERIYTALKTHNYIDTKKVEQTFCPHDKRFLPDRYVRGTCPKCGAADQYGDQCEICNFTYNPTDLKDARCSICGTKPERQTSEHEFVVLSKFTDRLSKWLNEPGHVSEGVRKFIEGWIKEGLRDWDIMRDGPYFGFPIPGHENKYFYVWLDAPIGYISNTERWCKKSGRDIEKDYWQNPNAEIYHFIGKDIIYFHTLFWPAMLMASSLTLPKAVYVHGYLTVEGKKMSKSRGTLISARSYLKHLDPQYLRYYYASKLTSGVDDLDLSFTDFVNKVNAELINKIANLASRSISFLGKRFSGQLCDMDDAGNKLLESIKEKSETIAKHFKNLDYNLALEEICLQADKANLYFQENAPWELVKTDEPKAQKVCVTAVNISRILAIYLQPVLPKYAAKIRTMLNEDPDKDYLWYDVSKPMTSGTVKDFIKLVDRVEMEKVTKLVEENKAPEDPSKAPETVKSKPAAHSSAGEKATTAQESKAKAKSEPGKVKEIPAPTELINFDKFMAVDIRAAKIIEATDVPDADKILRLTLDLGPLGKRNVFAGIKKSFPEPKKLEGKIVAMVINLEPRKMKFGISEGMVLAAGESDKNLALLELPEGTRLGERIS